MSLFNRAEVIDQNFTKLVEAGKLPPSNKKFSLSRINIISSQLISIFESQVHSRHMDIKARKLKNEGKCFYTIGSSGHEGNAVFGNVFSFNDMAFLHYRSGAFFLERSKQIKNSSPIYDMALSFMASSEDPISGGRHKVIGSKELNIPPQTSTIASHLPKAVGTAYSIDRAKDLNIIEQQLKTNSIVVCSFGDASVNHSSALSAFNTASLIYNLGGHVPIVFICEDNGTGISVPTENKWIEKSFKERYGIKYILADGLHLLDLINKAEKAYEICRNHRVPVFLHMKTIRLMGHAGSDLEIGYKSLKEIEKNEFNDPLLHSSRILIENGCLSKDDIISIYENSREQINHVFDHATLRPKLKTSLDVMAPLLKKPLKKKSPKQPLNKSRKEVFGSDFSHLKSDNHMAKNINYCLRDIMLRFSNTLIFGQDVEKKGGVYGITKNIYDLFGSRRIFNSPIDETSIIGFAIGLAHNGFIPIPEIQFLAYYHNAQDQIRGEAATLSFFSNGKYSNPMVLRIPGLAYQKGFGGHFHNENSLTVFRDIPGIIIAVPSNGSDAVRMMRTAVKEAYEYGRIIIFIEPIALYMQKDLYEKGDKKWSFPYPSIEKEIGVGQYAVYGSGKELAIITYGNGLYLSLKGKKEIEKTLRMKIKVIDLRWLSPINVTKLLEELGNSKHVLIVDECRKTGCHGEGLLLELINKSNKPLNIKLHAAEDSFISLGPSSTTSLPSKDSIIKNAISLINEKN